MTHTRGRGRENSTSKSIFHCEGDFIPSHNISALTCWSSSTSHKSYAFTHHWVQQDSRSTSLNSTTWDFDWNTAFTKWNSCVCYYFMILWYLWYYYFINYFTFISVKCYITFKLLFLFVKENICINLKYCGEGNIFFGPHLNCWDLVKSQVVLLQELQTHAAHQGKHSRCWGPYLLQTFQ